MKALLPSVLLITSAAIAQAQTKDIVDTAVAAGKFKTLATALTKAGLIDTLKGKGPFTVFAPTDKAFAKLPKGTVRNLLRPENRAKLRAILTYHVVASRVDALAALKAKKATTVQGKEVRVMLKAGQLQVNSSKILVNDVVASNGVIHIIDTVLIPPTAKPPSRSLAARQIIEQAIDIGVPLFNDDNPKACASIYRLAATALLNLANDQLSEASSEALSQAVQTTGSDVDKAWALRRALDQSLVQLMRKSHSQARRTGKTAGNANSEKVLFQFENSADRSWRSVNDDVMGGVSKGRMVFDPDTGLAMFTGALSKKNNGGFSTVRSAPTDLQLAGSAGLILRVRGDGRTYRVQALRSANRWEMGIFQKSFATVAGEWREIRIPFDEMKSFRRGRRIRSDALDPAKIRSLGFSIADKNEAPFTLEVDWIKAYGPARQSAVSGT